MGAEVWESRPEGYLGVFLGARYVWDRGLGFSPEAAPLWDSSALFWENKAGPWPSQNTHENRTKEETRYWIEYLVLLDIMARKSYLLQEAIYSSGHIMVSYYNKARIE